MLVRAYRLTDKLGVVVLKTSVLLAETTLDGLGLLWRGLLRLLLIILTPILFILSLLARLLGMLFSRLVSRGGAQGAGATMARRAARREMSATVEEPLRAQNRVLSLLAVLLLAALTLVVLWSTSLANQPTAPGSGAASLGSNNLAGAALLGATPVTPTPPQAALLATPVPTATPLPSLLEVRGSIAYEAETNGQTDIWALPVGSRTPIRLTNSPEDERDPVWSPDGRRLAYASRQDGNWELYVYDVLAGTTTRLTYDLSFQGGPSWSPDGEWLVYESYLGGSLDLYIVRADASEPPIRVPGNADAPDFAPAWSPQADNGRRIAFVSWRDGNQDIYVFSLDDQSVTNITNTPDRHEDHPAWSPDGELLAFSALDEGREKVFVIPANTPGAQAQVMDRGRTPSWSPDGGSLIFTLDTVDGGQLIASPFTADGVVTTVISVPRGAASPTWTRASLPPALVNAGGLSAPVTGALYIEQEDRRESDPPYRLNPLIGVTVENAVLSDRVNDSFSALREATLEHAGWDLLGRLDDAFWRIDRPPQPGEERRNWLMTGRAFALPRSGITGFPPPLEVVREDVGVETTWRLYVRVSEDAQSGELGEPLRHMPWDFASRTSGDVTAYDQGGRLKTEMPSGYYIDFTDLAEDYGWHPLPAGRDWRANANSVNFWLFAKTDGLSWYEAMREIYTDAQLGGFVPTATLTPIPRDTLPPAPTLAAPTQGVPTQALPTLALDQLLTPPTSRPPTAASQTTPLPQATIIVSQTPLVGGG